MISIADIQTTAKTAIEAQTFFYGKSVLVDFGAIDEAKSSALRDYGVCVVVEPIVDANSTDKTKGDADLDCSFTVLASTNPAKLLALASDFNVYRVMSEVIAGVLAWKSQDGIEYFTLDSQPVVLYKKEPGLWEYSITFRKLALANQ